MIIEHKCVPMYYEVGNDRCLEVHGAEPDHRTHGEAWDTWNERHQPSDLARICLDSPAGDGCEACTAEDGEVVPWGACKAREWARAASGQEHPAAKSAHSYITVLVGTHECLDRDCEEYFDDDGEPDLGVERCSHIKVETSCACQLDQNNEVTRICSLLGAVT